MADPASRLNAALSGCYAIERELGEGGMATVYLADDLKHERTWRSSPCLKRPARFASGSNCASSILEWSRQPGLDVSPPPVGT